MTERWKAVVGWEGFYEVSDQGRVRSVDRELVQGGRDGTSRLIRSKARIRKLSAHKSGHLLISLRAPGEHKTYSVHRLVLEAFVGPCPPGLEACHYNGVPSDNTLDNLRWGTRRSNVEDMIRHGKHTGMGKTHCKNGHPLSGDNLRLERGGKTRRCKACARLAVERHHAKQN